jgi:hypothetical protein
MQRGEEPPNPIEEPQPERVAALCQALRRVGFEPVLVPEGSDLTTAALAIYFQLGLQTSGLLAAALFQARMALVMAEALSNEPGSFHLYPMNLPPVVWGGEERS